MNKQRAKALLKALRAKHVQIGPKWVNASCPLAPWTHQKGTDTHPSFGINVEKRSFFCFSCSNGGSLEDLLFELLHYTKGEKSNMDLATAYQILEEEYDEGYEPVGEWEVASLVEVGIQPWPEGWLNQFSPAMNVEVAFKYLLSRHLLPVQIDKFDIRYDANLHAVCFPMRDKYQRLVGMRGRLLSPGDKPRFHDYECHGVRNHEHFWFNEDKITWTKPVILTESAFDAAAVYRWYPEVLSPLSAGVSKEKIRTLLSTPISEIICFFDSDQAGTDAAKKFMAMLGKHLVVKQVEYPTWLVEQYLSKGEKKIDPGMLLPSELAYLLANYVNVSDHLKTTTDV